MIACSQALSQPVPDCTGPLTISSPCALQHYTTNRLGLTPKELSSLERLIITLQLRIQVSHMACSNSPGREDRGSFCSYLCLQQQLPLQHLQQT